LLALVVGGLSMAVDHDRDDELDRYAPGAEDTKGSLSEDEEFEDIEDSDEADDFTEEDAEDIE
jgi:hypothetical protein